MNPRSIEMYVPPRSSERRQRRNECLPTASKNKVVRSAVFVKSSRKRSWTTPAPSDRTRSTSFVSQTAVTSASKWFARSCTTAVPMDPAAP